MCAQTASSSVVFVFFFLQVLLVVYVFMWGNLGKQENRKEISYDDSMTKQALTEIYQQLDGKCSPASYCLLQFLLTPQQRAENSNAGASTTRWQGDMYEW